MSTALIQVIKSILGKDVTIDTFQKGTRTFYNATKLWKHLGSNSRYTFAAFLRLHRTRDHIVCEYGKLVNQDSTIEKVSTESYSHRKPVPAEILDTLVMSGLTKESTIYLEETLFILYAKHISTDIEIAIINTYLKYNWMTVLSQPKKSEAQLDVALQDGMKHLDSVLKTMETDKKETKH